MEQQLVAKALEVLSMAESGDSQSAELLERAWSKFVAELKDLPELQGTFEQMAKQQEFLSSSLCLKALITERSAKGWWNHAIREHVATWLLDGTLGSQESNEDELDDIGLEIDEMFSLHRFARIQKDILVLLTTSI